MADNATVQGLIALANNAEPQRTHEEAVQPQVKKGVKGFQQKQEMPSVSVDSHATNVGRGSSYLTARIAKKAETVRHWHPPAPRGRLVGKDRCSP